MKQELEKNLRPWNVTHVKVNRDADINGRPAIQVDVTVDGRTHEFQFAKDNTMNVEQIANVIVSYLESNTHQGETQ